MKLYIRTYIHIYTYMNTENINIMLYVQTINIHITLYIYAYGSCSYDVM